MINEIYIKPDCTLVIDIKNENKVILACKINDKNSILNYFYTEQELRKLKLEKLNENVTR
jgi:hypothetical protein